MPHLNKSFALSFLCVSLLTACGGGGGGGSSASTASATTSKLASMSAFITDNLATEYSKVWVGITDITLVDDTGAKTPIFTSPKPFVFNISSLASVSQLLASSKIAPGKYTKALVTLADNIQLVTLDGTVTTNAVIKGDGTPTVLYVDVNVDTAASSQIVLDFDLAQFTYNKATNRVVPVVVKIAKKGGNADDFDRNQAEVHGTVTAIDDKGLTVTDKHLGENVRVLIGTNTQIISENNERPITLKELIVGARIEAHGIVQEGASPTITARIVQLEGASDESDDTRGNPNGRVQGDGRVIAIAGTKITIKINDANFMPGADDVVIDAAKTKFAHGSLTDIKSGSRLSFRGMLSGATIAATVIDINGALSNDEKSQHGDGQFSDVRGTVVSVAGGKVELKTQSEDKSGRNDRKSSASDANGNANAPSATRIVAMDLSNVEFARGKLSCVAVGSKLEVAGLEENGLFIAKEAILENGCTAANK